MSVVRTRHIQDFFEVPLEQLRPNTVLSFAIFTFLKMNNHVILLKPSDDTLSRNQFEAYQARGLKTVWISNSDREAFDRYLNPPALVVDNRLSEAIAAPDVPADAKSSVVAQITKTIIQDLTSPETRAAQAEASAKARAVVEDVLKRNPTATQPLIEELWMLSEMDPELEHAVTVSTYSVLFALAFGRMDPEVLADVALAGLLHDAGLTQISPDLCRKPWHTFESSDRTVYANHVSLGLDLIQALDSSLPPRVLHLISQHHEKFNGSGFPKAVDGFEFDDLAQLIAMAELLEALSSGLFDGTRRTLYDAFEHLKTLERDPTFPEYFNPEIFQRIVSFMSDGEAARARPEAERTTQKHLEEKLVG